MTKLPIQGRGDPWKSIFPQSSQKSFVPRSFLESGMNVSQNTSISRDRNSKNLQRPKAVPNPIFRLDVYVAVYANLRKTSFPCRSPLGVGKGGPILEIAFLKTSQWWIDRPPSAPLEKIPTAYNRETQPLFPSYPVESPYLHLTRVGHTFVNALNKNCSNIFRSSAGVALFGILD